MMGRLPAGQNELFYDLCLESYVPEKHVLRALDRFLDFGPIREHVAGYYSDIGRPSVDPELMIRMLLVGYCYGIRSERRLCEEVHLNLGYRWFCRLGLEDQVPNHSTFSKNRHGRFRDSELFRFVFESVVERCIDEGLVGGEGFAVDASIIKADAHRARGFAGQEGIEWEEPGRKTRAVREYLDALDHDEQAVRAHEATRKAISLTDPASCWTSALGGPAYYAYSTNYLIDTDSAIIVGVQASPATLSEESKAARTMLEDTEARFGLKPDYLAGDTGYGNAQMLGWLVEEKHITPYIPVFDKSEGKEGQFGRSDFRWEPEADRYVCPGGKALERNRRRFKKKRTGITKANTIIYRASQPDCRGCALKAKCCPKEPARKIHRSVHEEARDVARALASTEEYAQSRNERKKVEMHFAHLKTTHRLGRLRLRGPTGAQDEFTLAGTAQNLMKLAKLVPPTLPEVLLVT
jgi:transposase